MHKQPILSAIVVLLLTLFIVSCTGEQGPEGPPGSGGSGTDALVITTVTAYPPVVSPLGQSEISVRVTNPNLTPIYYIWELESGDGNLIGEPSTYEHGVAMYTAPNSETVAKITVSIATTADSSIVSIGEVVVVVGEGSVEPPSEIDLYVYEAGTQILLTDDGQTESGSIDVEAVTNISTAETVGMFNLHLNGETIGRTMDKAEENGVWTGSLENITLAPNSTNTVQVKLSDVGGETIQSSIFTIEQVEPGTFSIQLMVYEAGTQIEIANNGQTQATSIDIIADSNVPADSSINSFTLFLNGDSRGIGMDESESGGFWQGTIFDVGLIENDTNTFVIELSGLESGTIESSEYIVIHSDVIPGDIVEIYYDDGDPGQAYDWNIGEYGFGNRITQDAFADAKLVGARFYLTSLANGGNFSIRVYEFDGEPTTQLIELPVDNNIVGWVDVDLTGESGLLFSEGTDFLVAMVYNRDEMPPLGFDTSGDGSGRAWDYNNGTWASTTETYFIRAVVQDMSSGEMREVGGF